jgi:hypothetical protein
LVQTFSQLEGYGGAVSNVTATAPELTAEPFSFAYDYTRKDYPDWSHHQITAPLAGLGLPPVSDDPAKAGQPILLGEPTETHFHDHLYQVRTIHLAVPGTPTGSAEVVILFSKGPRIEQVRLLTGPDTLKSAEKAIAETKFDVPFPDDGPTRLVHSATLSCGKYSGCTFVLMPLNSAH